MMGGLGKNLVELKHSVKLYIDHAGGLTVELSSIGLKLIDVLESIDKGQSPNADLSGLSATLVKSLFLYVLERIDGIKSPESTNAHSILKASYQVIEHYPLTDPSTKRHYLLLLSQAYRYLSEFTGIEYHKVTDSRGHVL